MELEKFIELFADQFDETDANEIQADTKFRDLDEWSSLVGLGVIAFVKTQYGKTLTAGEMRACNTVEELYNLVAGK